MQQTAAPAVVGVPERQAIDGVAVMIGSRYSPSTSHAHFIKCQALHDICRGTRHHFARWHQSPGICHHPTYRVKLPG
ncbi:hypothetical protein ACO0LG_23930 [Undibacterium sp. Ji42W]|uniref:hypothetical protein n=1 Tax=Undibacterium sp. Ji42W TaxID=3413039 RepID=UPI003BF21512